MHMADALVSPTVGGTMWVVSAGLIGYCSVKAKKQLSDNITPLMGVFGAFVFAVQMINFSIPATGSSGHLGGGLLLAILLGPWAAFLTLSSILTVQALFFADGGLLSLGCNIFNLGFIPCLLAYPIIYKPIAGNNPSRGRIITGAIIASVVGVQIGSLGVVLETTLSGITELPFSTFVLFMQPIHLAIGLAEGFATASIILFLLSARPELIQSTHTLRPSQQTTLFSLKTIIISSLILGGFVSWFASTQPDGLEWSILKTTGAEQVENKNSSLHDSLATLQDRSAILPDYGFSTSAHEKQDSPNSFSELNTKRIGTTFSGLLGSSLLIIFTAVGSFLFKLRKSAS